MFCVGGCFDGETGRFFVRQMVRQVLFVGENSASSLICGSGGGVLYVSCLVCFVGFFCCVLGGGRYWEGASVSFLCLKTRFHCE